MEKEEIVKKLTKCERTGKQRDGTNYVYPNNGKEETNITTPTEMDVSEQKWTLVRAFKNEEEADEEMERSFAQALRGERKSMSPLTSSATNW